MGNLLELVLGHQCWLSPQKSQGVTLKLDFEKAYDKVRWDFVMEVLKKKIFPPKWLEWMKQIIEGGNVGININGSDGHFFNNYKGLRQRDPL
jgi:hypothetical protein